MPVKDSDIEQAVDVLSTVFGSRESVIVTILQILKDDGDITSDQQLETLRRILAQQNQRAFYNGSK
jgi:hypothetical protein